MNKLRKLQIAQIILLEKLNEICIKNKIKYSLAYGTIIGSIRHKGFIPWDNDIDIFMKRSEYEKFLKYFQENDEIFLQNYLTDKNFGLHISRLMLKDTFYEDSYNKLFKRKKNIYIDIFPIDEVGNNIYILKIKFIIIKILTQLKEIKLGRMKSQKLKNTFLNYILKYLFYFYKLENIDEKIEKLCLKIEKKETKFFGCYFVSTVKNGFFEKDIFDKTILKEFENKKYPILEEYDLLLRRIYGDYMSLPSIDERNKNVENVEKSTISFGKWEKEINTRLNKNE